MWCGTSIVQYPKAKTSFLSRCWSTNRYYIWLGKFEQSIVQMLQPTTDRRQQITQESVYLHTYLFQYVLFKISLICCQEPCVSDCTHYFSGAEEHILLQRASIQYGVIKISASGASAIFQPTHVESNFILQTTWYNNLFKMSLAGAVHLINCRGYCWIFINLTNSIS